MIPPDHSPGTRRSAGSSPVRHAPGAHRTKRLLAALLACGALTGASGWAQATDAARDYDLPAAPLSATVNRIARDAGLAVTVESSLLEGKVGAPVRGRFDGPEALRRALAGTGLELVRTDLGSYTVRPAPQPAADGGTLAPVRVVGRAETATGPVEGYVARRSATATKTDTPLIETPQSISVVSREQMRDREVQSVTEAILYSAGIIGDNAADVRYDKPVIRGFAARQFLDGLYVNYYSSGYNMPLIEPYGLERVEILRGPSSVLYGANSPGGLLNLVSKRPTDTPLREINLQAGTNSRLQGSFDFSDAVDANGVARFRLTGLVRDSDTQTDHARDNRVFLAPSLVLKLSERSRLTLLASYQHDKQGTLINFLPREGTLIPTVDGRTIPSSFFSGEPGYNTFDRKQYSLGYQFEHRFSDALVFRQNARYMRSDLDYTGVYAVGWSSAAKTHLRRASLRDEGKLDSVVLDNQLQADFGTGPVRHTALVGLDYQRAKFKESQGYGTVGAGLGLLDPFSPEYGQSINPIPSFTRADQNQRQLGIYAQDQMKFGERWILVASARKDWARSDTLSERVVAATGAATGTNTPVDQSDFTYRLGMVYRSPSGLAPYVSHSTSFQPQAGTDYAGTPFKPTTGKQTEIGVKYQPAGSESYVIASVYDLRQQNVLTADPDLSHGPSARVQTGEIRSRGLELEGAFEFDNGLKLLGAYTYMDMEVTRSNAADLHKTPTNRPRHMASLWADYTLRGGPLQGLGFGAGVRYMGSTWGDAGNTFKVGAVALFDAALHYQLDRHWRFSLNASNLFDKSYIGSCGSATTCYYGYRRTVLATATYRW